MSCALSPPQGWSPPPGSPSLCPDDLGLPALTEPQFRFLISPARNRLFIGGFDAGHVQAGAYACILEAAHPRNRHRTIGALSPTSHTSSTIHRAMFEEMHDAFAARWGFGFILREDKGLGTYHTIFGSRIMLLSYRQNPKRLSGHKFAAAWIDDIDAEHTPQATLTHLAGRVTGGTERTWWTTTPRGDTGAVAMFKRALESADPEERKHYATFRAPSWTNPAVTRDTLRRWLTTMSQPEFDAFVCANVAENTRRAVPEFRRAVHVTDWWPADPKEQPWIMAVDWGQTHAHVMAAWIRPELDDQIIICDEWHGLDVTDETTIHHIGRMCSRMGTWPRVIFVDGAPNAKPANVALGEYLQSAAPMRRMTTQDKLIWASVRLLRGSLAPAPGKPMGLLLHQRICGEDASPHGILAALEGTNRSQNADGELIDRVAENVRLEHAFDCARYLCIGQWGIRGPQVYSSQGY